MKERVAILHYAGPPGVGGVESMISYQARGLSALGYPVRLISGNGEPVDKSIEVWIDPLFSSTHPDVLSVKQKLDSGWLPPDFEPLVDRIYTALSAALEDCYVCIAHNVLSLNKNLPLTVALARLYEKENFRLFAWCSDVAWINQQYISELHSGYPWDFLRIPWSNVRYITISEDRQHELAALFCIPAEEIEVITPGIDPANFFQWTPSMKYIEQRLQLLDADRILLLPARLTRRKNIEFALNVLAELKRNSDSDYRLVVTGPPGPHNPANPGYFGELIKLREELGLQETAHFLYELGESAFIPDDTTVANLYHLADALFFPSLQEGFGIPLLEAGLMGLPVFCSDLPPFHQIAKPGEVHYFDPILDPPAKIAEMIQQYLETAVRHQFKLRVRRQYRWDKIVSDQIVPLLEVL